MSLGAGKGGPPIIYHVSRWGRTYMFVKLKIKHMHQTYMKDAEPSVTVSIRRVGDMGTSVQRRDGGDGG